MPDNKKPQIDSNYTEFEVESADDIADLKAKAEEIIQQELKRQQTIHQGISAAIKVENTPKQRLRDPDGKWISTTEANFAQVVAPPPEVVEEVRQQKRDYIADDNLLKIVRRGSNSFELLDKLIEEIAEETASMKFDRSHNEGKTADTVKISKQRSLILKSIADLIVIKRELAQNEVLNLKGAKMQAVFKFLIGLVRDSLAQVEGVTDEQKELFFMRLQKNLVNFEERATEVADKVEAD
jgi:hypothetical protein